MKIAAFTLFIASFAALIFALLQNPSVAKQDTVPVPQVPSVSSSATGEINEKPPIQHVGSDENQPL
jgi:hypothetical protein